MTDQARSASGARRHPTIRDIAREAGVSVGTVSHYLNGTATVTAGKAEAVRRAMQRLDYAPNANARSLRSQVTRSLGLILPNLSNPFYAELASNVGSLAFQAGYELLLGNSFDDEACESMHLAALWERRIDGALVVATDRSSLHRHPKPMPFPCVFLDREVAEEPSVATDNRFGGRLALEHLLSLGHSQIALIIGDGHVRNIQERLDGARQALEEHDSHISPDYIVNGSQEIGTGRQAGRWWQLDDPPTAVFATNDIIALGAWQSCVEEGVRVPDDVSLVGFDDIQWASLTVPPLTTVRQDLATMATRGLARLVAAVNGEPLTATTEHICPELVLRESTGAPPENHSRVGQRSSVEDGSPRTDRGRNWGW